MLGEIISGGLGLLGSLFGGKKKQTTTSEVDYGKMAASASAAGFNPLTAIRNGGSAGFTTTTSPTISAMPEVLGNLGGILGNALDKKLDPIEAKRREVDTILLDRQLGQLKMGPQVPVGWKPRSTFEGTKVSTQLAPRVGPSAISKSASVPANFIGPPTPKQYVEANGGKPLFVPYWDQFTNRVVHFPNSDLPDLDQMPVPSLGVVANETANTVNNWRNRHSPAAPKRQRERVPGGWVAPRRPSVPSVGKGR